MSSPNYNMDVANDHVLKTISCALTTKDALCLALSSTRHLGAIRSSLQLRGKTWASTKGADLVNALGEDAQLGLGVIAQRDSATAVGNALSEFHRTFILGRGLGEELTSEALRNAVQATTCKVLSDPRGIFRTGTPTMRNYGIYSAVFLQPHRGAWPTLPGETLRQLDAPLYAAEAQASADDTTARAYRFHAGLLYLIYAVIKPIGELSTESLDGEAQDSRFQQEDSGYSEDIYGDLSYKPEHVTYEQLCRYSKIDVHQLHDEVGQLDSHPAVMFVRGWLHFKTCRYEASLEYFLNAEQHSILRATCILLAALARFHMIHRLHSSASGHREKWALVALNWLFSAIHRAIESTGNEAVEAPLLADAMAAVAMCFVILGARDLGAQFCRIALSWSDRQMPSKLVIQAAQIYGIDVPGLFPWTQLEQLREKILQQWARLGNGNMAARQAASLDPMSMYRFQPYESCFTAGVRRGVFEQPLMEARLEQLESDLEQLESDVCEYLRSGTDLTEGVQRTCQVCNAPATSRCGHCRKVWYCGTACQRLDWTAAHREYF